MRRQASPADCSGEAKLIEPLGIVVGDAAGQNLPLPGVGGNFKSLKLAHDFERGALALNLSSRRHMLPAQEPLHELGGGDRLNLLAQSGHGQAMDARQQPPLAPLGVLGVATCKIPAQDCAAGFHAQQRGVDFRRR